MAAAARKEAAQAPAPEDRDDRHRCIRRRGCRRGDLRHITEDTTWFVDQIEAPAARTVTHAKVPRTPAERPSYDVRF